MKSKIKIANTLSGLSKCNFIDKIKYNLFCKNITFADDNSMLIPYKNSVINISDTANCKINGALFLNGNKPKNSKAECFLTLGENSSLNIDGYVNLYYNSEMVLYNNATVAIKTTCMNAGVQVRCMNHISIGENCLVARDVFIMDYDAHRIEFPNGKTNELTSPISIGDHVWLGVGVKVLQGVTIGNGSIIAAGSVVTRSIPENCLAAGVPAKVIKENVTWHNENGFKLG